MSQTQKSNKVMINFMNKRKTAMAFSLLLIIISIGSLAIRGLNLGIDFTGGYLIEADYQENVNLDQVRTALADAEFKDAQVQNFGSSKDIIVRIAPRADINKATIGDSVLSILKTTSEQDVNMRRVEFVGPQVGDELRDDGGIALLAALGGILIYISLRFQLKSAVGAILALTHDVIITVGVFSVLQIEFDLTVLASILAVIGYSLNDTVVVLDRIRETFRSVRKTTAEEILNLSINQTLTRTLVTSLTTLLVLFALFFFGGEIIHGFALALIIGVIVGTYSSIYIASSTLMIMNIHKQDFLIAAKEEIVDDAP
ncbi:MAG: protein translocase subunit SecF [Gammaproteobacteria bacterium]|nr:MAG: protein translocase subunit SecF [Gammaproteobacteria bacterium]